ncbi:MAG: hypothetical protein Aureis2KO_19310 [Aureisphaera sp.]
MVNLKRFLRRKKPKVINPDEQAYILKSVFKDLTHQLQSYKLNDSLSAKLKLFNKSDTSQKIKEFPRLYLDIEDFLLNQKEYANKSKQEFREVFLMEYAGISEYHELYAVFLPYEIQKVALSRLFLKEALAAAKKLLGNFKDTYLSEAEKLLDQPFLIDKYSTEMEIHQILNEILAYANSLQAKLSESLGDQVMLSIFNQAYTKHFNNYYLLEAFTTIVYLVPEDLMKMENAQMPSKAQMSELLKTQLKKLEEVNLKLNKELLERKYVEKKLENSERMCSAVLHNSLNATMIIDQGGEIIRWNIKAEKLFGEGDNLFKMLPKVFTISLKKTIGGKTLKEMKDLTSQSFTFNIGIDGVTKYFQLKISPIFVDENVLFYCIAEKLD